MAVVGREMDGSQEQRVFIMRHGDRQDSVNRDWWRTAKRPYDTPLSNRGHEEAPKLIRQRIVNKVLLANDMAVSAQTLQFLQTYSFVYTSVGSYHKAKLMVCS